MYLIVTFQCLLLKTRPVLRRSGGVQCTKVNAFKGDLTLAIKKNVFLTNKENKQAFINLLASILSEGGISVIHAHGDADVLIAKTGLLKAAEVRTVVVGNDTYLLVLLLYHARAWQLQRHHI